MRRIYASLLLVSACNAGVITVSGQQVHGHIWEETERSVRYRASADMGCPPQSVRVDLVRRQGRYPVEVFAQGCGQQALYTRALRRSKGRYTSKNTEWERASQSAF